MSNLGVPSMPLLRSIFLRLFLCLLATLAVAAPANALCERPEFDLRAIDFSDVGDIGLKGDWLFTYGELLSPAEAHAAYYSGTMLPVETPNPWTAYLPESEANTYHHGYASYLVRLRLPEAPENPLMLMVDHIADAYEIYWVPMEAPETAWRIAAEGNMTGPLVAGKSHRAHSLTKAQDGLLLINVRGALTSRNGIIETITVFDGPHLQSTIQIDRLFEGVMIGFILIIAALNFCLFVFHRKDFATFVLTFAGVAILIRFFIVGDNIETVFGAEWHRLRIRVEYANYAFLFWTAVLLNQTLLFQKVKNSRLVVSHAVMAFFFVVYSFAAPLDFVTASAPAVDTFGFITLGIILCGCFLAMVKQVPNAGFVLLVWLAIAGASICDLLRTEATGYASHLLDMMFVLGLLAYSVQVGSRVINSINRAEFLEEERALLKKLHQDAVDNARRDHLTGLLNRQAFDDELSHAWLQREKADNQMSLILFDIDHFKAINDTHGHPIGDKVLKSVAELLKNTRLRKSDRICRYGGEEFALILPGTRGKDAVKIAERLRKSIAKHSTACADDLTLMITCSFGVATASPNGPEEATQLIEQADLALYRAKSAGRNRVERYGMPNLDNSSDCSAKTA